MAKEDLLHIRELIASKGMELTPNQVIKILNEVKNIKIVDEPGLVSEIKRLRQQHGNSGTS